MSKTLQALMGIPMLILVSVANAEAPRIMTDEEMDSVVAGAPIYYPDAGLIYDSETKVLVDLRTGLTSRGIEPETAKFLIPAYANSNPIPIMPEVPAGMSPEQAAQMQQAYLSWLRAR